MAAGICVIVIGGNGTSGGCTGAYSQTLDEDGDGYTNADEIDNGTDPCSAGDTHLESAQQAHQMGDSQIAVRRTGPILREARWISNAVLACRCNLFTPTHCVASA